MDNAEAGLSVLTSGHRILELNIQGFPGAGVDVGGDDNVLAGNYIGTNATGTTKAGNVDGIVINGGSRNTVGGTDPQDGNVISGNDGAGVSIRDDEEIFVFQWDGAAGNNTRYYVLTSSMTWSEADSAATALGGHLLAVSSQAEQDFLDAYIFTGDAFSSSSFWTGLNDVGQEGNFVWTSGEPVSVENWYAGQPSGEPLRNAVYINEGQDFPERRGRWFDAPEVWKLPAIL